MRIRSHLATTALGVVIAFVAKDFAIPFLGVAAFGLVDRLLGLSASGSRQRNEI